MSTSLRVVYKAPGIVNKPEVREVPKGLASMQKLVAPVSNPDQSSLVECVYEPVLAKHGIDMWANEEGRYNGCRPNFLAHDGQTCIVGPVFFASHDDEGDTVGLSDEQIKVVQDYLARVPVSIF